LGLVAGIVVIAIIAFFLGWDDYQNAVQRKKAVCRNLISLKFKKIANSLISQDIN